MEYTRELCSCGFPQSYPLPHEHDRTERERQIIKHYEDTTEDLYEALKEFVVSENVLKRMGYKHKLDRAKQALAKAEGK